MRFVIVVLNLMLIFAKGIFASESRLVGLNYFNSVPSYGLSFLVSDNYNIAYIGGYVNQSTNFLILEPKPGGIFERSYGMLKYSFATPFEIFNFCLIFNYPYPELSVVRDVLGLSGVFRDVRDKVDVLVGVNRILGMEFIRPYLGVGYASVFSKTEENNNVVNEQSISQLRFALGSVLDFKTFSLDALMRLCFPSGKNLTSTSTNIIEGGFGFDVIGQPKVEFSKISYLLGLARYLNCSLPSTLTNYRLVEINVGASYNFIVNNVLVSFGGSVVNISEYMIVGQTYIQDTYLVVPVYFSLEVPMISWFVVRGGINSSIYASYVRYEESTTTRTTSSSSDIVALSLGFSLAPINNFSIDWVVSYTFLRNVFVNGGLPWILSGAGQFNNVTSQVSFEYKM